MSYLNEYISLYDIVDKFPEVVEYLKSLGLNQLENKVLLETLGKDMPLNIVCKSKSINVTDVVETLNEIIDSSRDGEDKTIIKNEKKLGDAIEVVGVLPCPVRVPLLEKFHSFTQGKNINYELKAASAGLDWLIADLENETDINNLPDVFMSAGFDIFFDERYIGKFKSQKQFKDISGITKYNRDFDNEEIDMKDPDSEYSIIGVVPAVFMVNTNFIDVEHAPQSWEELLFGDYEGMVTLPVGDFDLFNAILLNIYKKYGEEGIVRLKKLLSKSQHPSEMVKSNNQESAITIMPYFFTKMARDAFEFIWPSDGAIVSPIFLLSKKSKEKELKEVVDLLCSKEVGEILSHNGRFPSTNPDVDNRIDEKNKYMWLGWDYINANDIGQLISTSMEIFNR